MVEGELQKGRNGGSVGGTCHKDELLGRWGEMDLTLGLLFYFMLCGDDGEERFRGMKSSFHISQDACDTCVVM